MRLNRVLVLVACLGLLLTTTVDLDAAAGKVKFGGRVGANLAKLRFSEDLADEVDNKMRFAICAGGDLEYGMNESVSLVTGLHLTQKGGKLEVSGEENGVSVEASATTKLTYLTVPAAVKFALPGEGARPYFKGGGEINVLMSAKEKYEATGSIGGVEGSIDREEDIKEHLKSLDLALILGAGVDVAISDYTGFFEVGFGLGLMDIDDTESTADKQDSSSDVSVKNQVISFAFGILF